MVLLSVISLIFLCSVHALPTTKLRSSPMTLPVKRHQTGTAKDLSNAPHKRTEQITVPASFGNFSYFVEATIGDQQVKLVLDTLSGNTWVGASKLFTPSSSAQNLNHPFTQQTEGGPIAGTEFSDTVSVGGATVSDMWFGVTNIAGTTANRYDGVLGLGLQSSTAGVVDGVQTVPTFMQSLASGSNLPNIFSLSFARNINGPDPVVNGELVLGGFDLDKLSAVENPCYISSGSSLYWTLDAGALSFGTQSLTGDSFSAIIGTSYLPIGLTPSMFSSLNLLTGITLDNATGLGIFPPGQPPEANLTFNVNNNSLTLTPSQYLLSTSDAQGLPEGPIYTWITSSQRLDLGVILGEKFMENFYAVFAANYENSGENVVCLAPQA